MTTQYLVFDIGGTTIKYGLIDEALHLSHEGKCLTEHNHDGLILKQLQRVTRDYQAEYSLAGIGVSTAGIVGADGAIQYAGPTISDYQGTPIKAALMAQTGLPVFVVNDVDAALLGEQLAGGAKGATSAYCVALGTGIGGAYVEDGRLMMGAHATANSIGYTLYDPLTKTNYEQRASTLTLEYQLAKYQMSVKDAFEEAKRGTVPYVAIINDWAAEVATGLASILLLFDPDILLIGGAVSLQGQYLVDLLNNALKPLLPPDLIKTKITTAELADKAQLYGAMAGLLIR
ncbi:sugar kinase and transcription regulator [Lactobacillus plantarum JDM1] [Lactiplantibacillus plantarum]|uniref:Bifunctional protein: N-acetyl mannosamine kinase, ROK family, transcription regulator n=1 Tax=Lactiplantibacillus plantarum CMPG5300 TaxID=1304889 RepID=A0AAW3FJA5_LACPN|nr:ROK family protein [Lactiplantibacillus plantarum]ATI72777.1 ROK family protein [Lactiplantibacillus plantarum]KGH41457.1 bifunctional protein: N-acetyl mannosamine kinase, ROK family, transcription regulator [Lactiplantibacillus plantarum CMPG5300]MCZ2137563.1 ROK family protein [Lactiplantibacillus plantarum]MCZ2274510.1 ROK family protein [Lactiplantibacillus plantarum]VTU60680.1 sugar kinase and transcription regulator [Lactobacillus plantarum JDM1] [Lactiplantibacillus plantarum]